MTNLLEQLKSMTTIVADTGDIEAIRHHQVGEHQLGSQAGQHVFNAFGADLDMGVIVPAGLDDALERGGHIAFVLDDQDGRQGFF